MLKPLLESFLVWYRDALLHYGDPLVGFMMMLESTFVPLPSEAIVPYAAHIAHTHPGSKITIAGIILWGTFGSWLGAAIMYWAARIAGRPIALRYGRYFLATPEKIEGAERWASHYGSMGVFIARLLPVVRHLIGIPMGIIRLDFRWYSLFTILGSGIWCSILCPLGIRMGQDEKVLSGDSTAILKWVAGIMLALGLIYYFFVHKHMKKSPR